MDKKIIWLWLSLHFGAGSNVFNKLISYFEDEQSIYDSDDSDMGFISWLSDSEKKKLLDKNLEHAEEVIEWCDENDVQIIAYSDDNYPSALRELETFPAVLYCKGEFPNFDEELSISVVGTRSMTTFGQKNAYELGYMLSRGGAITVSGLARGIDGTVALGTLNALGTTVAILGSGINVIYPREHANLMSRIIDYGGAVITEYPPHTPPCATNFPIRNRLISGISNGTVIVEASEESGALITARYALKQGKPLFALPGFTRFHQYKGNNFLIREEKAILVRSAIDILREFMDEYFDKIDETKAKQRPRYKKSELEPPSGRNSYDDYSKKSTKSKRAAMKAAKKFEEILPAPEEDTEIDLSKLSETQLKIYNAMEFGKPYSIDELVQTTGLSASDIMSDIMTLMLEFNFEEIPGYGYVKNN